MSPQFMTLNIGDASGNLRRLGNVFSNVSCIKDERQLRRLGRQYCRCFFIVGGNGSDESLISDEPSYSGNLNCWPQMFSG